LDVVYCARHLGTLDCDIEANGVTDAVFALPAEIRTRGDHGSMHIRESLLRNYLSQIVTVSSLNDCDMRAWLACHNIESEHKVVHCSDQILYYQRRTTPEPGHWTDSNQLQSAAQLLRGNFAMVDRAGDSSDPVQ